MAVDDAPGRRHRGDRERVRRRSGRHRKDRDLALEERAEALLEADADGIGAVGGGGALIGCHQRGEDFGRGTGDIVAAEIHGLASGALLGRRSMVPRAAPLLASMMMSASPPSARARRTRMRSPASSALTTRAPGGSGTAARSKPRPDG